MYLSGAAGGMLQPAEQGTAYPHMSLRETRSLRLSLVRALLALQGLHQAAGERLSRSGRIGTRVSVAGAALLVAFGTVVGDHRANHRGTSRSVICPVRARVPADSGWPHRPGPWTATRRRVAILVGCPPVAAGGALVAIVVFVDPWHDLGLFTFNATWVLLGAHLMRRARQATAPARPQHGRVMTPESPVSRSQHARVPVCRLRRVVIVAHDACLCHR